MGDAGETTKSGKTAKGARVPPPAVPERDDVQLGADRCPFCRDQVRRRAEQWVLCAQCLARHHAACWQESPRCAACGHDRALRRRAGDRLASRTRFPRWLPAAAGVALLTLLTLGTWLGARHSALAAAEARRQAERTLAEERAAARHARELAERQAAAREEAERREALTRLAAHDQVDRARFGLDRDWERAWREADQAEERALARREEENRLGDEERARRIALARELRAARDLVRGDRLEEAARAYERLVELAPERADVWHERGLLLTRAGDQAGAIAACDRALALDPRCIAALITRGNARGLRSDTAGALADFEAALVLDPCSVTALNNRAVCRHLQGELEPALRDLDRALELAPRDPVAWQHRGLVLADLGRRVEAIQDLRRFLWLAPEDPAVPRMRARLEELAAALGPEERQQLKDADAEADADAATPDR